MALSASEQELFDLALAILPDWFRDDARAMEELGMFAKIMGAALVQVDDWLQQTRIQDADGPAVGEPDWLNQHARDRGTSRQEDETDDSLRLRLRRVVDSDNPTAITRLALLSSANAMLADAGVSGTAEMVELPRDQAYFIDEVLETSGTGGTFSAPDADDIQTFLPDTPFDFPPYSGASGRVSEYLLIFSGAAEAGNGGTFSVTGVSGNAAAFVNTTGVADVDATVDWVIRRQDASNHDMEGWAFSYLSRGDRMGRSRGGTIILILPYGTDEALRLSVQEMLRQKKGAGIISVVERRQVAP